ncbi:imelysin family protein [Reinekea marinisedimentorum]|uniref:Putative iron-regulated protein n=1 Tax=Reinekea marinisedimentorum TaxID=230495 RepID=A0A4R3ICH7_9GAMM|nr:imelysin family protein [Reinekea marinisedimentorum]TCS43097.1 putative iron-regulated protein [Reinekea marinisedimentorum]
MKFAVLPIVLTSALAHAEISKEQVVTGYADLAFANYSDALKTATSLQQSIKTFTDSPSAATLEEAKIAWLNSRPSYQQSEVFRFGNTVVDDWEGQLNAWPLDEGLIDYVDSSYAHELGNEGASANIVANKKVGDIKISRIKPSALAELNEFGGSEANVATGYHAIEFLLWGQDLNGYQAGAGNRPWTDYAKGDDCTNGNCKRRAQYLNAAAELLVEDLEYMVGQWSTDGDNYRAELESTPEDQVINKMLFGMGSLALGELAGERIKVALTANSPEDEHDCFSDNTHNSHYFNGVGVENIYYGRYLTSTGETVGVPGLRDLLLSQGNYALVQEADAAFTATRGSLAQIVKSAEAGTAFDQLIAPGNKAGEQLLTAAIGDLVTETAAIEKIALAVGISQLSPDDAGHEF